MKLLWPILTLIFANYTSAAECLISVAVDNHVAIGSTPNTRFETQSALYWYSVSTDQNSVRPSSGEATELLAKIDRYVVKDKHLWLDSKKLGPASALLVQARQGEDDIVILQRSGSSFSSPTKMFKAFSGHPVQVEAVWVVVIHDGTVMWSYRLFSIQSSSVEFQVKVWKA